MFSRVILGSHQKLDRMSRRALNVYLTDKSSFPPQKMILKNEGKNGPDGMQNRFEGKYETWHYYDPYDPEDGHLLGLVSNHYKYLVKYLKAKNQKKAAFEAAWLAHALVDGMTPSHHYPLEKELEKIRGEGRETRTTRMKRIIIPGKTKREIILKNWQMWGVKGLFSTHFAFEGGLATIFATIHKSIAIPNRYDLKTIKLVGLIEYYKRLTREIATLDMYDDFIRNGWTSRLAKVAKKELATRMAVMTTLAWYLAAHEAGIATGEV
jgi:hypothetical protein